MCLVIVGACRRRAAKRCDVQLARTLRLSTIAEGIETAEQLERRRALGCDHGQGYHFARPMPGAQISEMLAIDAPLEVRDIA